MYVVVRFSKQASCMVLACFFVPFCAFLFLILLSLLPSLVSEVVFVIPSHHNNIHLKLINTVSQSTSTHVNPSTTKSDQNI